MCLSKVYVAKNGEQELIMSEIASLKVESNKLRLTTLLGEHKQVSGKIREIDFLTHRIILENKE
jgi:predicted RNA-binding protein